jgi:hypothetical protein
MLGSRNVVADPAGCRLRNLAIPAEPAHEFLGSLSIGEDVADVVDTACGLGRELLLEIGNVLES